MKMLPQVLFWLGLISVPFAWLVWYFGSEIEIIRPVLLLRRLCSVVSNRRVRAVAPAHPAATPPPRRQVA